MTEEKIKELISNQRNFFKTGKTLNTNFRILALKRLKKAVLSHIDDIHQALEIDLKKSAFETDMCETGMLMSEISYMISNLEKFSKKVKKTTDISQFAANSFTVPSPYGTVLIISPWNYPLLLTLEPLVDAIAAGNTAILKPSAYSPATTDVIKTIISECFPEKYIAVVDGGRQENTALLDQHFDMIFFTGSKAVGKVVMESAAKHLTPVVLELGGKSPCIIDKSAKIKLAARRIVFGKYLNLGQTCVAPDYILCHESVKDEFIKEVINEINRQFGSLPLNNSNYGKMINEKHFNRVSSIIDHNKVIFGGQTNIKTLQISPTVMDNVSFNDKIMQEEIFGPVMPIITFNDIREIPELLYPKPKPLAFYIFTENKKISDYLISKCQFGGGCINDVIIHLANSTMGFGGVEESGMGSYHGKAGFDAFSHHKSIVDKKTFFDMPIRYQPYNIIKKSIIKKFLY